MRFCILYETFGEFAWLVFTDLVKATYATPLDKQNSTTATATTAMTTKMPPAHMSNTSKFAPNGISAIWVISYHYLSTGF